MHKPIGKLSGVSHYQVKFPFKGEIHYGIADMPYGLEDERGEYAQKGELIVSDAVLPNRYIVKESDLTDLPHTFHGEYDRNTGVFRNAGEYRDYISLLLVLHEIIDNELKAELAVGRMFSTPVGDGSAHYVITKVNPKTCKVEWRGFCLDRWVDRRFGYGGNFRKQDLSRFCHRGIRDLFGSPQDYRKNYRELANDWRKNYGQLPKNVQEGAAHLGL